MTPALQEFEEDKTTDSKAEVRHEAPTLTPALQELQEGEATDSKAEVRHEAPLQEGEPHPTFQEEVRKEIAKSCVSSRFGSSVCACFRELFLQSLTNPLE